MVPQTENLCSLASAVGKIWETEIEVVEHVEKQVWNGKFSEGEMKEMLAQEGISLWPNMRPQFWQVHWA